MTPGASISRSVLSDQIKDLLLQEILDGRYAPGARIVETRVARELGTSQAPVREALRDLEGLGIVEAIAFRGACVRRLSADELLEAFVIRAELEGLAARLAIPRLTDEDIESLSGHVREMQRAAASGDAHAEATADASFHGTVVELSGNRTLQRVWRTLEPFSRTYLTIMAPGVDRRDIADQHVPVLDALRRRDVELAVEVLHHHFAHAAEILQAGWERAAAAEPEREGAPAPLGPSRPVRPLPGKASVER